MEMVDSGPRRRHLLWILAYAAAAVWAGVSVGSRIDEGNFGFGTFLRILLVVLMLGALGEEIRQYRRHRRSSG
ncbi:hypothetical protein D2L64_17935 [Micromonospora radicis]|uniref:Uncharacterized protein n=1 Tax=Micromonospora radicis TaxID=1894971 RepID=A0A418MS18_9ACTN|nr:hypothetical protein D2L64_17935 [Micromonospora radicis]